MMFACYIKKQEVDLGKFQAVFIRKVRYVYLVLYLKLATSNLEREVNRFISVTHIDIKFYLVNHCYVALYQDKVFFENLKVLQQKGLLSIM